MRCCSVFKVCVLLSLMSNLSRDTVYTAGLGGIKYCCSASE
jgi:hypothetical protein